MKKAIAVCGVILILLGLVYLHFHAQRSASEASVGAPPAPSAAAAQSPSIAPSPATPPPTSTPAPTVYPQVPAALATALDAAPVLTSGSDPLRKFPYPYRAMLAITSDCDSATPESFAKMHRFLNTTGNTDYGPGLGLDISDSFFVYDGNKYEPGLMAYCSGIDPDTPKDAALIKKYYDCGWIDSIHTFGDFSNSWKTPFSRQLGLRAWELLSAAGIAPSVWIDHGSELNVQNFGAYNPNNVSKYQAGDDPNSPYYHTDVTLKSGVRYAWYSRDSDVFGRDYPLTIRELRDGQSVWSFQRYTGERVNGAIDWTWRPGRLHDQITEARLDALVQNGQYCIIAQHLDMVQPEEQMGQADIDALRLLASRCRDDRSVLVARTSRLLDYAVMWKYLSFQAAEADGFCGIRILRIDDPVSGARTPTLSELSGLTFYCTDPEKAAVYLGGTLLPADALIKNAPDETGRKSVSIPWFPEDTADYTA